MEPFTYGSLASDKAFRVVFLESGQADTELQCRIECHDTTEAPEYEALSYVWGDSLQKIPLESGGKQLLITSALDAALRRLRLPDKARVLWVDQLCINQDDLDERTQQVQLMKSIYSNAKRVLVWLGADEENRAPGAKSLIAKIHAVWDDQIGSLRFPGNDELEKRGMPSRSALCWKDLGRMLNMPYFERIWVVQECRVASDLAIYWGTEEISWSEFYHTYYWIATNNGVDADADEVGSSSSTLNINSEILFSTANCNDPNFRDDVDWLGILKATRMLRATDCRDKVYGLLGLFGNAGALIRPDYRKPAAKVFAEFAAHMIPRMQSLKILSFAQLAKNDQFPLWAPRWEWDMAGEMTYKPFEHYEFNASRGLLPMTREASSWDILAIKGILIDDIEHVTMPLTGGLLSSSSSNLVDDSWTLISSVKSKVESLYRGPYELVVAFIWTLTAGQSLYPHILMYKSAEYSHLLDFAAYQLNYVFRIMEWVDDSPDEISSTELQCLRSTLELATRAREAYAALESDCKQEIAPVSEESSLWIKDFMQWAHSDKNVADSASEMLEKFGIDADASLRYQSMMGIVTCWRKLFVTKLGYMGLGAHGIEPGDKICVLFGGATPYIVRPTTVAGEYLFMGECYVHGLMDGEAISLWEQEKLNSEWLHLR